MAVAPGPPPSSPTVLGIDLGTSSVKAVVSTPTGRVLAEAGAAYPVTAPRPGWSQTDPQDWLDATALAVAEVLARSGATPVAVGLSGQMHGLVLSDAAGRPLRPAMLWSDARAVDQAVIYRELPAATRRDLANPFSPGMAGPMLGWLARHEPEVLAGARWALQPKDWLRARLTGRFCTEPSDASATLLYDLRKDRWAPEVLDALGARSALLPELLPGSATPAGGLDAHGARLLGLPPGTAVAAGAADTAAAALGSGLVDDGALRLTIGTGIQLVRPVGTLPEPLPDEPVTHLYRAATEKGWYRMGAGLNGGLTLAWVCRVLGADWQELYAAAALPPVADAPYFLPQLHGERTPYLDPQLRGAWTDLGPGHTRQDLLRAALEGVAFTVRTVLQHLLGPHEQVDRLLLAGGGTVSPDWRQLLSDVLQQPLSPAEVPGASGRGAALLAALAADLTDESSLRQAPAPVEIGVRPRPAHLTVYRERHAAHTAKLLALQSTNLAHEGVMAS